MKFTCSAGDGIFEQFVQGFQSTDIPDNEQADGEQSCNEIEGIRP